MKLLLILAISYIAICLCQDNPPTQVRLSYQNDPYQMAVTWATKVNSTSIIFLREYQTTGKFYKIIGNVTYFDEYNRDGLHYIHRVYLQSLRNGKYIGVGVVYSGYKTRYEYLVQSDGINSTTYNFKTKSEDKITKLIAYGDLGRNDGSPSLPNLIKDINKGDTDIDAILHVGDFAYDLRDGNGTIGDLFFTYIENVAAYVPYMTCPGNHEIEGGDFSNYKNRFTMPEQEGSKMWYSFDLPKVHIISYSTEVYYNSSWAEPHIKEQYDWLENDLQIANLKENREKYPWIIAFGHRPMYCSNFIDVDCANPKNNTIRIGLEDLFQKYGVDMIIQGHEHSYERIHPVYNGEIVQKDLINPKAPIHIVSGTAGCNDLEGTCINPILKPRKILICIKFYQEPFSAKHSWFLSYGYGHIEVHNSTHLYWNEILDYGVLRHIFDEVWIVQENHGIRNITKQQIEDQI